MLTQASESVEIVIISANPVWVSVPDYKGRVRELVEEDGKSISVPSSLLPLNSNGKVGPVCVCTDRYQGSGD